MKYKLIKTIHLIDYRLVITYGIALVSDNKTLVSAPDLSISKQKVEDLIRKFNTFKPEPIHFFDIIEDELNDLI